MFIDNISMDAEKPTSNKDGIFKVKGKEKQVAKPLT